MSYVAGTYVPVFQLSFVISMELLKVDFFPDKISLKIWLT